MSDVLLFIKNFIGKGDDKEEVKLDLNAGLRCVGVDSLKFMELVVMIEKEFSICFDEEMLDYRKLDSLEELEKYVVKKICLK